MRDFRKEDKQRVLRMRRLLMDIGKPAGKDDYRRKDRYQELSKINQK